MVTPLSIHHRVREDLVGRLSAPRLNPYLQACGSKLDDAVELYLWNMRLSSAFFESLHLLEVGLRNCMHDALTCWCDQRSDVTDPWYRAPQLSLSPKTKTKIQEACRIVNSNGGAELPGRVVAELSFGFWWSLLAQEYNRSLWQPCLNKAFVPRTGRDRLHGSLNTLRRLRNRVAHHEPLHTRDLLTDYRVLLDTAERISMRFAWFIDSTSRVPAVLALRPGAAAC